jgi:hypothetical protein
MTKKVLKLFIGSASLAVVLTLITSALSTYGVISVGLARIFLILSWLVAMFGIITSEIVCQWPKKKIWVISVFAGIILAGGLIGLDHWAILTKARLDAETKPPPQKYTPPPTPKFALDKTPKTVGHRNPIGIAVTGNRNNVGNTTQICPNGICNTGNNYGTQTVNNVPQLPRQNSAVDIAGSVDGLHVTDSKVQAPPGGTATGLKSEPGSLMRDATVDKTQITSAPEGTPPTNGRAPVGVSDTSDSLIRNNTVCGSSSLAHVGNGNSNLNITGTVVTNGKQCNWYLFLFLVGGARQRLPELFKSWNEAAETAWSGLPSGKADSNRKEFAAIQQQLLDASKNETDFQSVVDKLRNGSAPDFGLEEPKPKN